MKKRSLSLLLAVCLMLTFASAAWATEGADVLPDVQDVAETPAEATEPAATMEEAPAASEPAEEPAEEPANEEPVAETLAEEPAATEESDADTTNAVPSVTSFSITADGETYSSVTNDDGSMYLTIPSDKQFLDCALSLGTSEAVKFVETTDPAVGNLYVSSADDKTATLNFNIQFSDYDLNDALYTTRITTTDYIDWTGTRQISIGKLVNIPLSSVAATFAGYENFGLAASAMTSVATGTSSAFQRILCNQDNSNVLLVSWAGERTVYTVTYVCGNATYVWQLPEGAPLVKPQPVLQMGQSFDSSDWYTDAAYTTAVAANATVTGDMTIYAKIIDATTTGTFSEALDAKASVLPIKNLEDWAAFVLHADEVTSSQRVELLDDIDCDGATYTALTFAGNFDGKGHTISNATFNANGSNSGMFATIGAGQIIANLTLSNITVNYGENAGVLAGSISATNSDPALIQNVQIRGGTVKGRNMGALVGYTFLSNIKYCSSRDTTFSGTVNAGGIAGISYSVISNCYSTCDFSQFSLYKGGIVAKNQEAGRVEWCWTTYSKVIASSHADSSAENNYANFGRYKEAAIKNFNFDSTYWEIDDGADTDFTSAVYYQFTTSEAQ